MTEASKRVARLIVTTADDHRELLGMLRSVEAMLEGCAAPAPGDLARRLAQLAEYTQTHAAAEEESEFYTWLPQAVPSLEAELNHLKAQHWPITAALSQLAARVETAKTAALSTEISVQIRSAIAALRQHEAGESSVLHKAQRLLDSPLPRTG